MYIVGSILFKYQKNETKKLRLAVKLNEANVIYCQLIEI